MSSRVGPEITKQHLPRPYLHSPMTYSPFPIFSLKGHRNIPHPVTVTTPWPISPIHQPGPRARELHLRFSSPDPAPNQVEPRARARNDCTAPSLEILPIGTNRFARTVPTHSCSRLRIHQTRRKMCSFHASKSPRRRCPPGAVRWCEAEARRGARKEGLEPESWAGRARAAGRREHGGWDGVRSGEGRLLYDLRPSCGAAWLGSWAFTLCFDSFTSWRLCLFT